MNELIIYAIVFVLLIGHCLLAGKMYRAVHQDAGLNFREKNAWKLKSLIFPGFFWWQYQKQKQK
ncbi:hypothetical protein SAMN03080617_00029 [Algoriphagus alkaliphilus]|uniref:Uncharacterized protein n=1 Tax=Algoriphagus alkaliphilus TaxID=279824 RepID=A0A1G5UUD9_9BACT|nr:hypothetical protein [Algoriphagus alkaliphilus]MBA4300089.1 hypothetical protein [Cyclobacterium sp.]SDA37233.1 hypothetical protein SAMN03080617_00029 [Algoriphagus alkaliphilus]